MIYIKYSRERDPDPDRISIYEMSEDLYRERWIYPKVFSTPRWNDFNPADIDNECIVDVITKEEYEEFLFLNNL